MKWMCKNCKPAKPCVLTYDNPKSVGKVKMPDVCPWGFITPSSGKNWEKIKRRGNEKK